MCQLGKSLVDSERNQAKYVIPKHGTCRKQLTNNCRCND
jgi:hypothetical protein